jgi:hypothetical protein
MNSTEKIDTLFSEYEKVHYNSLDPMYKIFYSRIIEIKEIFDIRAELINSNNLNAEKNGEIFSKFTHESLNQIQYQNEDEILFDLFNLFEYAYSTGIIRVLQNITGGNERGQARINSFNEEYTIPFLSILKNKINDSSSELILLQKFAKRVEWFTKNEVIKLYHSIEKHGEFEKILENQIRLYLFDNGHDFPISNPSSPSGRADIISFHKKLEPLVIEVKIYDKNKGYNLNKIKEGFRQSYHYALDYKTKSANLVVFVFDDVKLKPIDTDGNYTTNLVYQDKKINIIPVYLSTDSASGKKTIDSVSFCLDDLISE